MVSVGGGNDSDGADGAVTAVTTTTTTVMAVPALNMVMIDQSIDQSVVHYQAQAATIVPTLEPQDIIGRVTPPPSPRRPTKHGRDGDDGDAAKSRPSASECCNMYWCGATNDEPIHFYDNLIAMGMHTVLWLTFAVLPRTHPSVAWSSSCVWLTIFDGMAGASMWVCYQSRSMRSRTHGARRFIYHRHH